MADNNQPQQPALTINDLHTMATIIETCSERGAFEATELSTVGAVYNKLMAFLSAQNGKKPDAQNETPAGEEAKTQTETPKE